MSTLLRTVLVLAATALPLATSLRAQDNLRTQLHGLNAEWLVGKWTGTNSWGALIELEYKWALDGNVLEIDLEMGPGAYKGLIFRRPTDGKVVETGVDDGGGMTEAVWEADTGMLTCRRTATRPGGERRTIAVVNERVDDTTVQATVHSLSENGERGEEPLDTVILKRVFPPKGQE
jgi:hypothetical protein